MASTDVTVVLRPTEPHDILQTGRQQTALMRMARHGARLADVAEVRALADAHGVTVTEVDLGARQMTLHGDRAVLLGMGQALDHLPGVVTVLGLGDPPAIARPLLAVHPDASSASSLTALQVANAYAFPDQAGVGQGIAIIELGGGFGAADLKAYFDGFGIPVPTVIPIGVGGGRNVPGKDPNGADGEVLLDIEVAGAVAPGAVISVYFAPNTDQGFLAAITQAIKATPAAISISWGGPESSWSQTTLDAFDSAFADAASLGISVLAAAGDSGADDGTGRKVVDFPASSPHVTACGGTRLSLAADGSISGEVVWDDDPQQSATGGGYSSHFTRPPYQASSTGSPERGVPDISANADPNTGYQVIVDGTAYVIGGTSAVAPLLAGLVARLNAATKQRVGLLNLVAYADPGAFHDVSVGNNGGYSAGVGWDAASGLGSPDGAKLLAGITSTTPPTDGGGGGTPTPPTPPAPGGSPFREAVAGYPGLLDHLVAGSRRQHLDTPEAFAAWRLAHLYGPAPRST